MKWSELRDIAKKHGYEFFRHGKELTIERHWNQEIRKGLHECYH